MNEMIIECVSMEYIMIKGTITFIGVLISALLFYKYRTSNKPILYAIMGGAIALATIYWDILWRSKVDTSSPEVKEKIWKEAVNANKVPDIEITDVADNVKYSIYDVTLTNGDTYCIPYKQLGLKKRKILIKHFKSKYLIISR